MIGRGGNVVRSLRIFTTLLLLLATGSGCPGEGAEETTADGGGGTAGSAGGGGTAGSALAPCELGEAPSAKFTVSQRALPDRWSLTVSGRLRESPRPSWHQVLAETDSCRYMVYFPGACDPPCESDEICTGDGECLGWPEGVSGGELTVTGLGEPLVLHDEVVGSYFATLEVLKNQFGELTPVRFDLSGDAFPAVTLSARAVAEVVVGAEELVVANEAVAVTWVAGNDPEACVQVNLYTANGGHGLPIYNVLECVGPDSGSLTIPAEMAESWPPWTTPGLCAGVDCPYSEVVRYTRQVVDTDAGEAELTVSAIGRFRLLRH